MKKALRRAGVVGLSLGSLGCGEPARPQPLNPQELFTGADLPAAEGWRKFLDPQELHRAWVPPSTSPWRPYYKPTLIASIAMMQSAAMPMGKAGMDPAESEAALFARSYDLRDAAVFVDLPGEQSVVWAAALRRAGHQPVVTFNNWPHQHGVIRLERSLGALLYYAAEASGKVLPDAARPVFVLDRNRLSQKGLDPGPSKFDNRYYHAVTDFPAGPELAKRGIRRIFYVNPRGVVASFEEDDLVEYFASLQGIGIAFTYVQPGNGSYQLGDVKVVKRTTIFTAGDVSRYASSGGVSHGYYRPYWHYHSWHRDYWSRSSGAWGSGSSGRSFS